MYNRFNLALAVVFGVAIPTEKVCYKGRHDQKKQMDVKVVVIVGRYRDASDVGCKLYEPQHARGEDHTNIPKIHHVLILKPPLYGV
jgi:hypothetical protein